MSTINEAIDTAIKSIKDIDLNTVTADRTVNNQISDIGKTFGKAIKDYSVSDCHSADSYFQQQINGIGNPLKKVSAAFKNKLTNKKEKSKKLNYKTLTKETFKTESDKVAAGLKTVDKSGGMANVEKINVILRESVRDVVIKLGQIR